MGQALIIDDQIEEDKIEKLSKALWSYSRMLWKWVLKAKYDPI